ncbi:hypothetical protein N0B16_00295 [Chryseobacterium sp. GMJ5]|uniref:DUF6705 domain-containing protein n=1 Tax=Chryseobacterium gilvum TaxID=2976534 RepID=A0ABT2VS85_9FLAO|nr:DUF6705 family protein [Chryseobacterium gilvum]MCU7612871.1 hypothetical protein [Chryseobacterium gilvum]
MKTLYSKIITIFVLTIIVSCKAQQTYPLNTDYDNVPNYSYLKDLNNELIPYIGTYKATFQGNEISLYITSIEHKLEESTNKKYYQDVLSVRYIVRNNNQVLQDTHNMLIPANQIIHTIYSYRIKSYNNSVIFYYGGTNCGIGWGDIYLKKINATQISWEYRPDNSLIDSATCPPSTDKTVYLPVTKDLIFTKQ